MPDIEEDLDVEINPDDLKIDTYRSSGAAASISIRPLRQCVLPIFPPESWYSARMNVLSSRIKIRLCRC